MMRRGAVPVAAVLLAGAALAGCGGGSPEPPREKVAADGPASPSPDPTRLPGVGPRLRAQVPADARQVVLVTGAGVNSIDSTIELFERRGNRWHRLDGWAGHNGKKGWAVRHKYGDYRTPIGVFTLHDAGGVLADPGTKLSYTRSSAFNTPTWWGKDSRHIFDYTIAIDYNRVIGSSPSDQRKPQGQQAGGNIWLHMDNGRGTAACVSQPKDRMLELLRTLDPARHPVVVMGDRDHLAA